MAFLPHTNSFESMAKLPPTTFSESPSTPTPQHGGMSSKFKDLSFQDACDLIRTTTPFSNSGDGKPRSETSLLYPNQTPLTFKAGTFPHSLFYTIAPAQFHLRVRFFEALREKFPEHVGYGVKINQSSLNETIVEVALCDQEACISGLHTPVVLHDEAEFIATQAISYKSNLVKVDVCGLPLLTYDTLKSKLVATFSSYGIVRDIVLYKDDPSGTWFTGKGHVYLQSDQLLLLNHQLMTLANSNDTTFWSVWNREKL